VAYYRGTYIDHYGTLLCVLMMSVVYVVYIIAGQYLLGKVLRYFPARGLPAGRRGLEVRPDADDHRRRGRAGPQRPLLPHGDAGGDEPGLRPHGPRQGRGRAGGAVPARAQERSIPILTSTVLSIPLLFLGSILLESFFAIPGLGTLTVDAIEGQDFAVVRAMVFLGAILYIVGSILTDISYALVDPRIRLE
jgi:peptide/nickel transport system permease protein